MKKYILQTLTGALLGLAFFACSEEQPVGGSAQTGDATVVFRVNTPSDGIKGDAATRGGMVDNPAQYENSITNIVVLLFRSGRLVQAMDGTGLTGSSTQAKFTVTTRASAEPAKFYLLANTPFTAASITAQLYGKSPNEVKQQLDALTVTTSFHGMASPFAFWGETDMPAGLPASTPALPTQVTGVKMLRSAARAIITKSVDNGTLEITGAYLYRMNNKTAVIPWAVDAQNKVSAPTIPAGVAPMPKITCDVSSLPLGYYLSESAAPATPAAAVTQATCIVIGGKFGGSGVITYYRIDFEKDTNNDGKPDKIGEILRNHSYAFNIQSVSSPGWSTPEEAANNKPTGLKVVVKDWADKPSESFQNNEYTFTVSSREIPLAGTAGSENYTEFTTDAPNIVVKFKNGGTANATSIENSQFRITLTNKGGGQYRLTAVAKTDNATNAAITEQVSVIAHNLTVDIDVKQEVGDYIRAATTFMWIASDGTPLSQTIQSSSSWSTVSAPAWAVCEKTADGKLKVTGQPNRDMSAESRTGTIELKTDIGSSLFITVKQARWVEWTKGYLRGGDHLATNFTPKYEGVAYLPVTPAGTPLGLAAPAGDVVTLYPKRADATQDPPNYAMRGDIYEDVKDMGGGVTFNQLTQACDDLVADGKSDWRLPTGDELGDILVRKKTSAAGTLYIHNPDGVITYIPYTGGCGIHNILTNDVYLFGVDIPGSNNMRYALSFSMSFFANSVIAQRQHRVVVRCVRNYP